MPTGQRKFAREDGKYADFLDTNSGNLKPDGTAFIGSSSLAAPSDHIHPGGPYSSPYNAANQEGYAAWTWDPNTAYALNSLLQYSWASGKVGLTRIPVPVALSGLNGYLSVAWRVTSGGSPANSYIGLYVLAGGTLTLTGTASSDQTANSDTIARISTGITSFAADVGNTSGLFGACLIGTQGTTAGGPMSCVGNQNSAYSRGSSNLNSRTLQYGSGLSALPATITLSSCSVNNYCDGWFAVD